MRHLLPLFIVFLFSNLHFERLRAEGLNSNSNWNELRSERIILIYPDELLPVAQFAINAGEAALDELDKVFSEKLALPVTVVLNDQSDLANGFATYFPTTFVLVSTALPQAGESIDHYENWYYLLFLHEFTHLYTFRPVHGFYTPLKYLFGSIVNPNGLLPRWYSEGLAVEVESRLTYKGRLRAPSTFAALRALSSSKKWDVEDISRMNETDIDTYPFGQRPYLFGSILQHDLAESKGAENADRLLQRFSRRLPYLLNAPLNDLNSKDWDEYWLEIKNQVRKESAAQIKLINSRGEMPLTAFTKDSGQQFALSISPDQTKIAYTNVVPHSGARIKIWDRAAQKITSDIQVGYVTKISWFSNSKSILFDQINRVDRYNSYRDLYSWDLDKNQKPIRITYGARASDPQLSPDNTSVIYVSNISGASALREYNFKTNSIETLLKTKMGIRLSHPVFLDNRRVAIIFRNQNGHDQIIEFDRESKSKKSLIKDRGQIIGLTKTKAGLVYNSDQTGTFNLFLQKIGKDDQALTNSTTQVSSFAVTDDLSTIYLTTLTADGNKVFSTPYKQFNPPQLELPEYARFSTSVNTDNDPLKERNATPKDYNPWRYMLPKYWIPYFYPVDSGVLFQGATSGGDPIGIHNYEIAVSHDTVTKETSYGATYMNTSTPITVGLTGAQSNELLSAGSDTYLTQNFYEIEAGGYFYKQPNNWRWSLGGMQKNTEIPSTSGVLKYERAAVSSGLNYSSSREYLFKPSWGEFYGSLGWNHFLSGGNLIDYERYTVTAGTKLRGILPSQHSLTVQAKYSSAQDLELNKVIILGDRTVGGNYLFSLINSPYLLRGYPSGAVVGRNISNANIEYNLPLISFQKGSGTKPWYFRDSDMSIFVDTAAVDGAYYDPELKGYYRSTMKDYFTGTGLEFHLNNSVGYHFPLVITLGLYYGLEEKAGGGFTTFLGIGYSGFGGLDENSRQKKNL